MTTWVITRGEGADTKYRDENGRMRNDPASAARFPTCSLALDAAHVGDVIVQAPASPRPVAELSA